MMNNKYNIMRRILYLLPIFILVSLSYRIYSQSLPPMWQYFCIGNACVLTFSTQLIYSINITSNFTSADAQFITFTVPEQILQQQLYYCKTYDPFITSIDAKQCEFAWPAVVAITYPNSTVINYWTQYQLIALSYDNTTGLPQTITFPINLQDQGINGITLSPGTYYLYVYYPSPFLFNANSIRGSWVPHCPIISVSPSSYNGGWCGGVNMYVMQSFYSSSRTIWSGNGMAPSGPIYRSLYVRYNVSYPVIIGANPGSVYGVSYGYPPVPFYYYDQVTFTVAYPSQYKSVNVCIVPIPNQYYGGCDIVLGPGFYDLRQVLMSNGYDPNQYNEIYTISVLGSGCAVIPIVTYTSYYTITLCPSMSGIYLEYTPANS